MPRKLLALFILFVLARSATAHDGERTAETYPLLPMIFFGEDSSIIPERYVLFRDPRSTVYFVEDTITSTLNAYYNYLNILGLRLRMHPETTIEVVGCNNGETPNERSLALSRARADSVLSYLSTIWGIDPSRMKVSARGLPAAPSNTRIPGGDEENRRVEIISKDWEIMKPVTAVVDWKGYRQPGERYELIRFKFNSYDMGSVNERFFKETILERMNPSSEVTVYGYEDFADPENTIGFRRARHIVKLIKSSLRFPVKIADVYPHPRYGLDTQAGRFYHRSVMIEILNPPRVRD